MVDLQVNIIPVIGKADLLTPEEIALFKQQIMSQIIQSKIKIYEFPEDVGCSPTTNGAPNPEDEKERRENRKLKERVPFAVVGSNTLIESPEGGDKKIRGRRYPWGVVDVSLFYNQYRPKLVSFVIPTRYMSLDKFLK